MSVITYRDGIMASDSRAFSGSHRPIGEKLKIQRTPDGVLIGAATAVPGLGEWLIGEWWNGGCPDIASLPLGCLDKQFNLLAVRPSGEAFFVADALALSGPITAEYFGIGTGGSYALGAMHAGASAADAVRAAISHDPVCGGRIATVRHDSEGVEWL